MSEPAARPRLLIVDDNADELHMLHVALSDRFDVLEAAGGLEAYALACSERPAAIVLDIAMPVMDGWTVLRKLRANPGTRAIPVIVFTATDLGSARAQAQALGVQAIVQKPAPSKTLQDIIERILGR